MNDARWKGYATLVETDGGCRETGVFELLGVAGKQAAGARIVEDIERELAAAGIGHLPPRIPRDQKARVLLYNQDRPGIGAVLHLVRQLAEGQTPAGATPDVQIRMLSMLLKAYRPASKEDATPA